MSTEAPPAPAGAARFGAWFDGRAAAGAAAFFPRHLRHTEGEWAGRPFKLAPWQDLLVRTVFGWKRADGTRLIRVVYLELPRKNGKTEFAAGLGLVILLGDGERGGQVYSMGVDKDQAKLAFNKAGTMVQWSDDLSRELEVFKTSIYAPSLMASFKPLSSTPGSKHGFSPTGAIADELHEWPSGELHDVVHKGSAARRQPLEVLITTAGVHGRGYGWEMHEYACQVRDGLIEDPSFLPVIYAADPEDDWTDEATWRKANPNLGVSVKLEFLQAECERAKRSPSLENAFRRFHLNQWTEQATRWLPMVDWRACSRAPVRGDLWRDLEAELAGRECWGGLDLASVSDTCSLCWAFPPLDEEDRWTLLWRFWLPGADLRLREERTRVPYTQWRDSGALLVTEGNQTDYRAIRAQILADAERFRLRDVAFDRWNATHLVHDLTDDGLAMVGFGQGFASMSAPSKLLEGLVLGHGIEHGNHPVAAWQASNVAVERDAADNVKPSKKKATQKIDGIVAAVMALARASQGGSEAPASYTATHGVLVL